MRDPRSTARRARLCIAAILLLPCLASAETWPVKDFEVFVGERGQFWGYNEVEPTTPLPPDVKAEIETFLRESARVLEGMGFKPPILDPIITRDDGSKVYRVFYVDLYASPGVPGAPAARSSSQCGIARPTFYINGLNFLKDGKLSPKNYQDLAHELFHGIQANYPMFTELCEDGPGYWITEGTAQALGADVAAWSRWKINYPHRTEGQWANHRWGLRPYDKPLFVGLNPTDVEGDRGYGASSFWRYLGEQVAMYGGAGTTAVKPDYSYLIDFFNTVPEKPIAAAGSMFWLDQQLRNTNGKFKLGLNYTYANFINTFAAYGGTRVNPPKRTAAGNRDVWLQATFETDRCKRFLLEAIGGKFSSPLLIEPVAATCFRADWPRTMSQDLQVRIFGQTKDRIQALKLGTGGGAVVADPILVQDRDGWNATWIINIPAGSEPAEIIISNVAANPRYTWEFKGSVDVILAAHRNNLVPAPPASAPASSSSAPSGPSAINSAIQAGRVAEQLNEGMDQLNPNMAHGGSVGRNPRRSWCEDPFDNSTCRASTSISLEYMPGMFGSTMQSTGRGGVFGQFSSMMSGVAGSDMFMSSTAIEEAIERSKRTPGSHVSITIPMIDYGFTGTFNNAGLSVNAGPDQLFESRGPQDVLPGPGIHYPDAGVVTIEEYTPWQLRGSYSGHLTNMDRVNLSGDDPSLPIHENIQGTFNIVAPWQRDDRLVVETPESIIATVFADIQQMQAGQGAGIEQPVPGATPPPGGSGSAGGQGSQGGGVLADCHCRCGMSLDLVPQCKAQCAPVIAACPAGTAARSAAPPPVPKAPAASGDRPFLRDVPDACDVLDDASVRSVLAAGEIEPSGPRERIPKVTSQCGYRSVANRNTSVELVMLFMPLTMADSYTMPREQLRMTAGGFALLAGAKLEDVDGLGNTAFFVSGEDYLTLKVYSGINGTAEGSDEFTSELVLTYTLKNSELSRFEQMKNLYEAGRAHMQVLKKAALTTH